MIHSNELRIGNYLEYYIPTDDLGWQTTQVDWQDIRLCQEQNESFNLENRPIPLTEEWLMKFGFNSKFSGYRKVNLRLVNFLETETIYHVFFKNSLIKTIQYVHELQNVYFALTNTELTLTL